MTAVRVESVAREAPAGSPGADARSADPATSVASGGRGRLRGRRSAATVHVQAPLKSWPVPTSLPYTTGLTTRPTTDPNPADRSLRSAAERRRDRPPIHDVAALPTISRSVASPPQGQLRLHAPERWICVHTEHLPTIADAPMAEGVGLEPASFWSGLLCGRWMRSGERFCATRRPCLRPQCSRQLLRQPLVLVSELRVRPGRTGRRTAAAARCSGQTAVDGIGNPQHAGDMAAQLTLVGDVPAWRPETGHMLHGPKPDPLSSMGSQTPSVVGHPDGGGTDGIDPSRPLARHGFDALVDKAHRLDARTRFPCSVALLRTGSTRSHACSR